MTFMLRRRKLLFAVNAHAGKAAIRTPFLEILDTFVRSGYEPTVYLSQRAGELPEIVREEDPRAFMTVADASQILGEGFRELKKD